MWQITPQIRGERRMIAEFLDSFMSGNEHMQLSIQIHTVVAENRKAGAPLKSILERLDEDLQNTPITAVTGDALSGWNSRKKFLTPRQRQIVLAFVKAVHTFNGKFTAPDVVREW